MLGLEKIYKKKLMLYFITFGVILIGGVIFYFYQAYKITSSSISGPTTINYLEEIRFKSYKAIKPLYIGIFDSNKFKSLKEITIKETKVEVGRENPFEDPFEED